MRRWQAKKQIVRKSPDSESISVEISWATCRATANIASTKRISLVHANELKRLSVDLFSALHSGT